MAMKITMVRTADRIFDTEAEDTDIKEIVYKRQGNLYNSGFQTGVPGYVVKLVDMPNRVILVPEHAVVEVYVDKMEEEQNIIPELPEADVAAE
jgi:hypothetical protein